MVHGMKGNMLSPDARLQLRKESKGLGCTRVRCFASFSSTKFFTCIQMNTAIVFKCEQVLIAEEYNHITWYKHLKCSTSTSLGLKGIVLLAHFVCPPHHLDSIMSEITVIVMLS